jgi:hypothetical protein
MPAKIIDPAAGASTWAFGSHKCTIYKGSLTRNARVIETHQTINMFRVIGGAYKYVNISFWWVVISKNIIAANKGREAVTVYIIICSPAWSRSG